MRFTDSVCAGKFPGSHDSMSYNLDVNSSIVEPDNLKKFSWICCVRKIMRRWAMTQVSCVLNVLVSHFSRLFLEGIIMRCCYSVMQNETIIKQLDAGVRYFDLRIARKPRDTNPTRLYFHHGLYTQSDVEVKMFFITTTCHYTKCAIGKQSYSELT